MGNRSSLAMLAQLKPALAALVAVVFLAMAVGCGGDPPPPTGNDDEDPQVGDECDNEGETFEDLICEDGVWVEDEDEEDPQLGDECDEEGATFEDMVCEDGVWVEDEDEEDPQLGDECDEEGETFEDLICEDGVWVEDEDEEDPQLGDECDEEGETFQDLICVDGEWTDQADLECVEDEDCDDGLVCGDDYECVEDADASACGEAFFGQIDADAPNGGGVPTTDPFTHDAGLSDVVTFMEDEFADMDDIGYVDLTPDTPIAIDGAIVTAVEHVADSFFWVQDSEEGFYVRLGDGVDPEPNVGDEVSFDVEEVSTFNYTPQIVEVSDWSVDSSDNDVSYIEFDDAEIDVDEHFGLLIRVGAEIVSDQSSGCGGSNYCYDVEYGPNGEYSSEFRFDGDDYATDDPYGAGDCVTYVGPLRSFPGVYGDDPDSQLDSSMSVDTAWHSVVTAGGDNGSDD